MRRRNVSQTGKINRAGKPSRLARMKASSPGPVMARWNEGRSKGRASGTALGLSHGYHMGRCMAEIRQIPPDHGILFNKRVLFVMTGLGVPYSPIDQSLVKELRGLVRELYAVRPNQNVVQAAARLRPDLVLVLNGCNFFPVAEINRIRKLRIPTAIWLVDDPYYTDLTGKVARYYDYVFTIELSCVPFYRSLGCRRVHYLPLGVNPQMFRPQHIHNNYRTEICFIGSAFWKRVHFFDPIARYLAGKQVFISGWWWNRLRNYRLLRSKIHSGWLSPQQTASYYNGAKIVINLHRAPVDQSYNRNSRKIPAVSLNPRTFEIAATGAFQLTDIRQDMSKFYVPGQEIAVYTSPQDLVQKIEHYLKHEDQRREIALRGLRRTLTDHTYRKRLTQMLGTIF